MELLSLLLLLPGKTGDNTTLCDTIDGDIGPVPTTDDCWAFVGIKDFKAGN
jgi:hypothetical protein